MKRLYLILLCLAAGSHLLAQQNLVKNSSFEDGVNKGYGSIELKGDDKTITSWHSPAKHNPEVHIIPKKSVATAYEGRNAVGLVLGSGKQEKTKFEFITGDLSAPLEKGQAYCISFNIILQRSSKWAATDIGVLLHSDRKLLTKIADPTSLTASLYANAGEPIVNTKWNTYNGYYVATGGEQHISFGKFGDAESKEMKDMGYNPYFEMDGYQTKAYYQLDEISVKKVTDETDCGCAEELEETDEEFKKRKQPPYLFALDASGSMKRDGLFDSLRNNMVRFVKDLPDGTPVTFVTFASSSRKLFAGEVNDNTAHEVDSILSKASIGGGTNVFVGLQMGYESWSEAEPDSAKMVLISDGEFHVTPKIVSLVKNEYETKGRKLTLIQIGARSASGLNQIEPYMDGYIYTTQSELGKVVSQLKRRKVRNGFTAVNCECVEGYSDTMNYHFVIDYSGSMKDEKTRAVSALRYLFNKAPDNAMITITSFNTQSEVLYVGKKTDITMAKLTFLLSAEFTGGGTDPTPGVKDALALAKTMSEDRFSHIILITDLPAVMLSRYKDLNNSVSNSAKIFDLAASAIAVSADGLVMTHAQFDVNTTKYVSVNRMKFENDLFSTNRSSCDYTSQSYHYNPAKAAMKAGTKKVAGRALKTIISSSLGL